VTTLACNDLAIGYGSDTPLATGITLTASAGEFVCLLGRNGVGKSTLLRTIAGLHPAASGTVHLGTRAVDSLSPTQRAREIAVVLTERLDAPAMTVADVVESGRLPYTPWLGTLSGADQVIVHESLVMAQASDLRHRLMSELSDGQRQRVMVARALAQTPALLVLDEITAFLDLPSRVAIMSELRTLARTRGKIVLLSSHDLELSMQLADRLWLMPGDGSVIDGTPETLALDGELGRSFDHPMLRFSRDVGAFQLQTAFESEVVLSGEEPARFWSAQALVRHGVRALPDETQHQTLTRVTVRHVAAGWQWSVAHVDGTTVELGTLEQMTAHVRSGRFRLDNPTS